MVGIRLPGDIPVGRHIDVLVLNDLARGKAEGNGPQRVRCGVLARTERHRATCVPAPQRRDVARDLDRLAVRGRHELVESHLDGLRRGTGRGRGCLAGARGCLGAGRGRSGRLGGSGAGASSGRGCLSRRERRRRGGAVGSGHGGRGARTRNRGTCRSDPGRWGQTSTTVGRREEGSVRPGEVVCRERRAGRLVKLLGHGPVGCRVRGDHVNVAVSVVVNSIVQGRVRRRARVIRASANGGIQILEEGQVGGGHGDVALRLPAEEGIVEKLGRREGAEVPWVSIVVRILGVATNGNRGALGDARVDAVNGTERVCHDFVVRTIFRNCLVRYTHGARGLKWII